MPAHRTFTDLYLRWKTPVLYHVIYERSLEAGDVLDFFPTYKSGHRVASIIAMPDIYEPMRIGATGCCPAYLVSKQKISLEEADT